MANITKIEKRNSAVPQALRVAAYARVSMDSERLEHSLSAQISYYSGLIQKTPGWLYAGVYADDAVSGTGTAKRDEFNRLLEDCEAGKIDIILVKSISRFARNTVDLLKTVRRLKELGISVRFEKEHIDSLSEDGELMLTLLASFAQEESRSISENCIWGQRKRFADGKVTVPFGHFLGYDRGEDGNLVLNEEEAVLVRRIFAMFLQGTSPYGIAKILTSEGIPSPAGKDKWNAGTIHRMLSNEKYKGDALLQKSFTVDFLTKKKKKNEGEIPQYYVEGNHEAIVSPEVFELVQRELQKRDSQHNITLHTFSSRIRCGQCGEWYGSKIWHSNDKYRRLIWRCNAKYEKGKKCTTPHLTEEDVQSAFVSAVNKLLPNKDEVISAFEEASGDSFDISALEAERDELQNELIVVSEMIEKAIYENAHIAIDQEEYQKRYDGLRKKYERITKRIEKITETISDKQTRFAAIGDYLQALRAINEPVQEFDTNMWFSLVDFITVYSKEDIRVTFKDGTEIQA